MFRMTKRVQKRRQRKRKIDRYTEIDRERRRASNRQRKAEKDLVAAAKIR